MRENFMVWEQRKFLGNQSESPGSAVGKNISCYLQCIYGYSGIMEHIYFHSSLPPRVGLGVSEIFQKLRSHSFCRPS